MNGATWGPGRGRAGWHVAKDLKVPSSNTLEPLPPRSPELNPRRKLWLFLKERFLWHRLLDNYPQTTVAAVWKRLIGEVECVTSLCSYPWILDCISKCAPPPLVRFGWRKARQGATNCRRIATSHMNADRHDFGEPMRTGRSCDITARIKPRR